MNFEELKTIHSTISWLNRVDVVVKDINNSVLGLSVSVDNGFYTVQNALTKEDLQAIQAILNNAADAIEQVIKLRKDYLQSLFEKAEAALAALSDNLTPTNHE
jgi:hypothetical protein